MVTWHIPRHTAGRDPRLEHLDDITRGARPGALPGQPCTGLLIQHRQALQPAPTGVALVILVGVGNQGACSVISF
jgi:hypothetical protein